jgi:hypothetical protein
MMPPGMPTRVARASEIRESWSVSGKQVDPVLRPKAIVALKGGLGLCQAGIVEIPTIGGRSLARQGTKLSDHPEGVRVIGQRDHQRPRV